MTNAELAIRALRASMANKDLRSRDRLVLVTMALEADMDNEAFSGSIGELARLCGTKRQRVSEALRRLEDHAFIAVTTWGDARTVHLLIEEVV